MLGVPPPPGWDQINQYHERVRMQTKGLEYCMHLHLGAKPRADAFSLFEEAV